MRLALTLLLPVSLLVVGWWLLRPAPERADIDPAELPWNLQVSDAGQVRAFGLWLGRATLADAEQRFGTTAEAGLFVDPDGRRSVEAYFDRLTLAGLNAKLVLELRADAGLLDQLAAASTRRISLRSGSVRLELPDAQARQLRQLPLRSITYAPRIDLEPATLTARFGEPARIVAVDERRSHWLYPERGLDILVDRDGREVMQYLLPAEFDRVLGLLESR